MASALLWTHMASLNLTVYFPYVLLSTVYSVYSFISTVFLILLIVYNNKKRRCGLRDTRAEEKVCTRCYMQLRCAVDKIARRSDRATQPDDPRSSSCPILTCANGSTPNSTN